MREESATIHISHRFRGPDESGNGGYVCGLLGQHLKQPAEVILRAPPPLEQDLFLEGKNFEQCVLSRPGQIIAEGRSTALDLAVPESISFSRAQEASAEYAGFHQHPYPHCFVCGPGRPGGDGLRIFPGPLASVRGVAAPWIPDDSLAGMGGAVAEEFLWAALDCPGAWALYREGANALILGTLIAEITGSLRPGDHAVVMAWPLEQQGRRRWVGTALFSEAGECVGRAKAAWVELTPEQLAQFQNRKS